MADLPQNKTGASTADTTAHWGLIVGIISAIIGIAALITSYELWARAPRVKALSYEVLSYGPLVSVADNMSGRLQVSFDGKQVPNVNIAVIQIQNTGSAPLDDTDFKTPISLSFGEDSEASVLSAEVTGTSPPGVQQVVSKGIDNVQIKPGLLNPDDSITIKVLVAGGDGKIGVSGRIEGVSRIATNMIATRSNSLPWYVWFSAALWLIVGCFSPVRDYIRKKREPRKWAAEKLAEVQAVRDIFARAAKEQQNNPTAIEIERAKQGKV